MELRTALAEDRLETAYQPIVRVEDRSLVGVEALIRWNRPLSGPVSPLSIISIAEQSSLINGVGAWVLDRACRDHRHWTTMHPRMRFDLAVNVSARQLLHPTFAPDVRATLHRHRVDPRSLILEMTENVFIEDSTRVTRALVELNDLGIRIALDDFGTGYSSLSYLARLPVHIVKVDRSFITDTATSAGRTIVGAVSSLAHDLGLTVIAEGVETEAEHRAIRAIGCDAAQGFLYDRPMPAGAIEEMLTTLAAPISNGRLDHDPIATP